MPARESALRQPKAGIQELIDSWIPAPRLRGDKFTPAKEGAGMTNCYMLFLKQDL
jgi:hypothetical protein